MRPLRFAFAKANNYNRQAAMKPKKIVYYNDPLNDDFAGNNIKDIPFPQKLKYRHPKNPIWWFFSELFYHFLAVPILWLVGKLGYGVKVIGKKNVRAFWRRGVFFYGNHTQIIGDALMPAFMVSPRYINVIVHPNNINIPGIGKYVPLLGGLPLPGNQKARQNFNAAIATRVSAHQPIFIYPEAHIWPFYTGIRPFVSDSFSYPVYYGAPVFCFTNTYHKRKNGKVRIRTYIDGPFFPDPESSPKDAREQLRNEVYNTMCERAGFSTYQKIAYIKKTDD